VNVSSALYAASFSLHKFSLPKSPRLFEVRGKAKAKASAFRTTADFSQASYRVARFLSALDFAKKRLMRIIAARFKTSRREARRI
jgi:hypothetical protein